MSGMHLTQDGLLKPLPDDVLGDGRNLQDWRHGDNSHMQGPHLDSSTCSHVKLPWMNGCLETRLCTKEIKAQGNAFSPNSHLRARKAGISDFTWSPGVSISQVSSVSTDSIRLGVEGTRHSFLLKTSDEMVVMEGGGPDQENVSYEIVSSWQLALETELRAEPSNNERQRPKHVFHVPFHLQHPSIISGVSAMH